MGVSSLEYSARWGARWLDYGLVAKIINIMHDSREVEQEQQLGGCAARYRRNCASGNKRSALLYLMLLQQLCLNYKHSKNFSRIWLPLLFKERSCLPQSQSFRISASASANCTQEKAPH